MVQSATDFPFKYGNRELVDSIAGRRLARRQPGSTGSELPVDRGRLSQSRDALSVQVIKDSFKTPAQRRLALTEFEVALTPQGQFCGRIRRIFSIRRRNVE